MVLTIILFIIGLVSLLVGANYLVDGSTAIAKRFNVSDMIIGMTIVAIGTSMPEMVVSYVAAFQGNSDIAMGNVIGSNICNILLVLGSTIAITPILLKKENIRFDIPVVLLATIILIILSLDGVLFHGKANKISRIDGMIMLLCFALFMIYSYTTSKKQEPIENQEVKREALLFSIAKIAISIFLLIWGGNLMVNKAVAIAKAIGISDIVIASTIVAIGTSAPELATSITAAIKKNTAIALGNVLGSNVINIFLILGGSAVITPLSIENVTKTDYSILLSSVLLLTLFSFMKGKRLNRIEGIVFLTLYALYIYLIV